MVRILGEKPFESSSDYFDSYKDDVVGVINLKGDVFGMATNLTLKEAFFGKIRSAYHIPEIKALLILSGESALGEDKYIEFEKALKESGDNNMKLILEENALCQYIRLLLTSEKIIINGIRGSVIGAFLGAILSTDYRIASESVSFSFLDVKHEMLPQGALSYFLPRYIGMPNTKKILFSGSSISAIKACELGLVDEVVRDDGFEKRCVEIARNMSQIPSGVVRLTKRLIKGDLQGLEACFQMDSRQVKNSSTML